jgi:hypothetical protein
MKRKGLLIAALVILLSLSAFACGGKNTNKVTFYDGATVLKTVDVEEGGLVASYTPAKAGYTFLGWYATPALKAAFDFAKPVTEATSVFSSWKSSAYVADTREFIIAGTSNYRGAPLQLNSWGKVTGADRAPYVFAKSAEENTYTLTVNLYVGDEFQVTVVDASDANFPWSSQHGFGYVATEGENWSNAGGIYATNPNTSNIKVETEGDYTITLATEVGNDSLDKITYIRNGDAPAAMLDVHPSIAGTVTGGAAKSAEALAGTEWEFVAAGTENVYETTINLNKGDYFAVLLYLNSWTNQQRYDALTDDSKAYANASSSASSNITLNQSGKYKITFTFIPGAIGGAADSGTIKLERLGDFDTAYKAPYNTFKFKYAAGDVNVYVKEGARIPAQADEVDGVTARFIGWYTDLATNTPLSTTDNVKTTNAALDVNPKLIADGDTDSRDIYISGSFGAAAGEGKPSHNWQAHDANTKMVKSGHAYTYVLKVTETAAYNGDGTIDSVAVNSEFMFRFYEDKTVDGNDASIHTGFTLNGASVWNTNYDKNTTPAYTDAVNHVSGAGNIKVEAVGWYTITVDTFTRALTIVYSATAPAA